MAIKKNRNIFFRKNTKTAKVKSRSKSLSNNNNRNKLKNIKKEYNLNKHKQPINKQKILKKIESFLPKNKELHHAFYYLLNEKLIKLNAIELEQLKRYLNILLESKTFNEMQILETIYNFTNKR